MKEVDYTNIYNIIEVVYFIVSVDPAKIINHILDT